MKDETCKDNLQVYNPGTQEAIHAGCTCPVVDNHYGKGYQGKAGSFCFNMDCPIHGFKRGNE